MFMLLVASMRTRTGTRESKACHGSGGGPRFHTTKISPAMHGGREAQGAGRDG